MNDKNISPALVLGLLLCTGLALLGHFISNGIVNLRALERTITVKGLSEREVPANTAIWPIRYTEAENDLNRMYSTIQRKNTLIVEFLKKAGFQDKDITISTPAIQDRQAQAYGGAEKERFRYSGVTTITVYSENVDLVRKTMETLVDIGKQGIAITGGDYRGDYRSQAMFLFTKLNDLKPAMIEEATRNTRAVAEKFAQDSKSRLGKIKSAAQGQFTIEDRDSSNPFIKKVRVVSTVQYYLTD
jgi:uncharacterized protein